MGLEMGQCMGPGMKTKTCTETRNGTGMRLGMGLGMRLNMGLGMTQG